MATEAQYITTQSDGSLAMAEDTYPTKRTDFMGNRLLPIRRVFPLPKDATPESLRREARRNFGAVITFAIAGTLALGFGTADFLSMLPHFAQYTPDFTKGAINRQVVTDTVGVLADLGAAYVAVQFNRLSSMASALTTFRRGQREA